MIVRKFKGQTFVRTERHYRILPKR